MFDPDTQCTYADRVRGCRQPGDTSLGLSPHMDAGTVDAGSIPATRKSTSASSPGIWRRFDPFDGTHRLKTRELPSPAVCRMFRTYQGWTALTGQGLRDGTLRLIPIADGIAYVLLRAIQGDVADDDLCGARPGRALGVRPEWHEELIAGGFDSWKSSPATRSGGIPTSATPSAMSTPASMMRASSISARSPDRPKNRAYLSKQKVAFLAGRSVPTSRRWTSRSISRAAPRRRI